MARRQTGPFHDVADHLRGEAERPRSSALLGGTASPLCRRPMLPLSSKEERNHGMADRGILQGDRLLPQIVEGFLEATGMRALGLGERLKPIGDFLKTFFAGGARHAGIHIRVFMRFASDGSAQV